MALCTNCFLSGLKSSSEEPLALTARAVLSTIALSTSSVDSEELMRLASSKKTCSYLMDAFLSLVASSFMLNLPGQFFNPAASLAMVAKSDDRHYK